MLLDIENTTKDGLMKSHLPPTTVLHFISSRVCLLMPFYATPTTQRVVIKSATSRQKL